MSKRKMSGLRFRNGLWHIEKRIKGRGKIYECCETDNLEEAERYLVKRLEEIRLESVYGIRPKRNFRQAAIKYIEEATHKSLERDKQALRIMEPHLGDLPIEKVHMGSLLPYIELRRSQGIRSGTVKRELSVVRSILTLAARSWRDENDKTWIDTVPLIDMPCWEDKRKSYPLNWDEQSRLFDALPDHLTAMSHFKVNTGTREQEVCSLRWDWEYDIPALNTSVFIIPGKSVAPDWTGTKNKEDRLIVLNKTARDVVNSQRDIHDDYVFTYRGERIDGIHNNGWRRAWKDAGLPIDISFRRGPHNLKHTFGRRLRAAGVPLETRKVLMGHKNGDVTTHYSAPELLELINAVELIDQQCGGQVAVLSLLKKRG